MGIDGLWKQLGTPWPRRRDDALASEVRAELEDHLERATRDLQALGLSPAEAREEARRRFGDLDAVSRACEAERRGTGRLRPAAIAACAALLLLAGFGLHAWQPIAGQDWARVAPYDGFRWAADDCEPSAEVRHEGRWQELLAIDGLSLGELAEASRRAYGDRWRWRIAEDLVEVLRAAGRPPSPTVDLLLRDPATGEQALHGGVTMTAENRVRLYQGLHAGSGLMPAAPGVNGWARLAPYDGFRWTDADCPRRIEVRHDDRWHELIAIEGVETQQLVEASRRAFGSRWEKRIAEDLVEVLEAAGVPRSDAVELRLRDLATGEERSFPSVEMTAEKRAALWRGLHARAAGPARPGVGGWARLSPYTGVRWDDADPDRPLVRHDGRWWRLVALGDAPVEQVVRHARETWERCWRKRFEEDLHEVLTSFGQAPRETIGLTLAEPTGSGPRVVAEVAWSAEKRRAIWQHRAEQGLGLGCGD